MTWTTKCTTTNGYVNKRKTKTIPQKNFLYYIFSCCYCLCSVSYYDSLLTHFYRLLVTCLFVFFPHSRHVVAVTLGLCI